jgi:hypothetical protein
MQWLVLRLERRRRPGILLVMVFVYLLLLFLMLLVEAEMIPDIFRFLLLADCF